MTLVKFMVMLLPTLKISKMKKLLLLAPLLVGCTNAGMGSIDWSSPGTADSYTCEEVSMPEYYCQTGEHPNLCDC